MAQLIAQLHTIWFKKESKKKNQVEVFKLQAFQEWVDKAQGMVADRMSKRHSR